MGNRLPRRRYTGVPCTCSMCFSEESPSRRISSSRLTWGMTNRSPPLVITRPGMMARVSGILILTVVPSPGRLNMSTTPPIFSMLDFTTSMPTPRPEMLVTVCAVENPGRKIRFSASRSLSFSACSAAAVLSRRPSA